MAFLDSDTLPDSVLFICNQNAVRSPMAAALMQHFAGDDIRVASCGVWQGDMNPFAVVVMDEIGIDLSGHMPRAVGELEDEVFETIISLTPEAQHAAVNLTHEMPAELVFWPTLDPTLVEGNREQVLDSFRSLRDALSKKIEEFLDLRPAPSI